MTRPVYSTTFWRALAALFCGGAIGGAAWAVALFTGAVATGLDASASDLVSAALLALAVFQIYAIGLVAIGAPAWALLHLWRRRSLPDAMALGALLSSAPAGWAFLREEFGSPGIAYTAFAMVVGAVIGAVIWRIAYRRAA